MGRAGKVAIVHILVATDADYVLNDITAALGGPDVSFTVCRNGRDVTAVVKARTPDLVVLDLQIGSMGGMAVTMGLRLDESGGTLPHVSVLMLLDRQADIHLAKRCAADGYLVKPLNPLSLKRAARAILASKVAELVLDEPAEQPGWKSTEEEPVPAG